MYLMFALALGFAAWAIPVIELFIKRKKNLTGWSFALCSASLYLAICDTQRLVEKSDWAAIEDTHVGILFGATVLVAVTLLLNLLARILKRK